MATESYVIEDQLDPISEVSYRFYDDQDERSVKDKIKDIEYLEKIKEEAYRDFAIAWSQNQDVERHYRALKKVYDLEYDSDLLHLMSMHDDSSDLLRRVKAEIFKKIRMRIANKRNRIIRFLYEKSSPIDFSIEFLEKDFKEIDDEDVVNEHKRNPEYWMQKSYEYGVAQNSAQLDATPENRVMKNAITYRMNQSHFGKLVEEKARDEVEMMRQERAQKRVRK